jgi:hypothetical protein
METTILVLWAIGLVAAFGLTAVVLKLLALVLRTLTDLKELAERTATAADGLAATLSDSLGLEIAAGAAAQVDESAAALADAAAAARSAVGAPPPSDDGDLDGPTDGPSAGGAGELAGAAGGPQAPQ